MLLISYIVYIVSFFFCSICLNTLVCCLQTPHSYRHTYRPNIYTYRFFFILYFFFLVLLCFDLLACLICFSFFLLNFVLLWARGQKGQGSDAAEGIEMVRWVEWGYIMWKLQRINKKIVKIRIEYHLFAKKYSRLKKKIKLNLFATNINIIFLILRNYY